MWWCQRNHYSSFECKSLEMRTVISYVLWQTEYLMPPLPPTRKQQQIHHRNTIIFMYNNHSYCMINSYPNNEQWFFLCRLCCNFFDVVIWWTLDRNLPMMACELSAWLPKIFLRITGKPGMPNITKQGNNPFIYWLLVSNEIQMYIIYFQRYTVYKISKDHRTPIY